MLAVNKLPSTLWSNPKKCCEILMAEYKIGLDKVQFGLTKIFLRAGIVAQFETMRTNKLNSSSIMIQKHWKRFFHRRRYLKMREVALYVQNCMSQSKSCTFVDLSFRFAKGNGKGAVGKITRGPRCYSFAIGYPQIHSGQEVPTSSLFCCCFAERYAIIINA